MSSITDLLAAILAAKKGEEVRGSIHDAIEQCYEDGRAGVNDLQARQLIEAVAAVNEEQAAALEVLQARVEELESGEGGSSQQSTTIDIPTVLVDGGVVENISVNNNSTTTRHITFTTEFTETPKVMVAIGKNVGAVSQYGYLSANILYPTVTTTGFDFFLANRTGSDRSPGVVWYAYQPTVKTIDLDITIPETEGMTEAEVREITGPIAAAVDALKTGYDGTSYQTAAEAVRTQINDLHVLIGDEPGTAISADSIGYEGGSVADALAGLNGRLDGLGEGVPTEVRQALLTLFQSAAYAETGLTDEIAVIASWAAVVTAIAINQTSISISGASTSQLVATTTPAGGAVTWSSSDTSVATVSNSGLVTGVGNGTATITASCGGKTATCSVTVSGFATLTGINAVYTQGGTVYDTDTLASLKSDLVVTASYDDSSTETIPAVDYTLSGTLAEGTSTITVSYGGFTDTFTVTVTEWVDPTIHRWDFTQSLTDSVGGVTATLSESGATQDSTGLHISSASGCCNLGNISSLTDITIEMDIGAMDNRPSTSDHGRLLVFKKQSAGAPECGIIWNKAGYWATYFNSSWSSSSGITNKNGLANSTVKLVYNTTENYAKVYVNGELVITQNGINNTVYGWFIGSSTRSLYNVTVTGLRIYTGVY